MIGKDARTLRELAEAVELNCLTGFDGAITKVDRATAPTISAEASIGELARCAFLSPRLV